MKNIIFTFIQLFVLLIVTNKSFAQVDQILVSSTGEYFYNERRYQLEELDFLMSKNPQAYYQYRSGLDKMYSAKKYLIVSGVALGTGVLSFIAAQPPKRSEPDNLGSFVINSTGDVANGVFFGTIGTISILTGSIVGLAGISKKINSTKRIKNSILIYNQNSILEQKETSSINFQGTSNGLGLVYKF